MHKRTKSKLYFLILILTSITFGVSIILYNLSDNISFFVTPTELIDKKINKYVKLGGYVKEGSINNLSYNNIEFLITDRKSEIKVAYRGNIPMIFREHQGVVVSGKIIGNIFKADTLFARHDEKYIPKDIIPSFKLDNAMRDGVKPIMK